MVARALAAYRAPGAGADCAGAVLQPELRLLQRVRQGLEPVPLDEMFRRIDHLGRLGTAMIGISGGEPLTHPELDEIIRRIRRTGAIAGMITNGYLLNVDRIERLNRAGLDHMQISIDNLEPDEVSKKSLKVLDKKLVMLAEYADVSREHQFGGGRGLQESQRRAGDWTAGAGAGL
jgi:organic radical activating enzyme